MTIINCFDNNLISRPRLSRGGRRGVGGGGATRHTVLFALPIGGLPLSYSSLLRSQLVSRRQQIFLQVWNNNNHNQYHYYYYYYHYYLLLLLLLIFFWGGVCVWGCVFPPSLVFLPPQPFSLLICFNSSLGIQSHSMGSP